MKIDTGASWEIRQADTLIALRALEDESVDALITDPPYSSGGQYRGDRTAAPSTKYQRGDAEQTYPEFTGDNRDQRGFLAWCSLWLAEAWRVTKNGGAIAVFSDWRMLPTMTDAVQAGGWTWRGILPWCKPMHRPQKGRFGAGSEFVVWGSRGAMPFERGVDCLSGYLVEAAAAFPDYMICNPPPTEDRVHLTEKPLAVMRELVKIAPPGGLVLDPFAGSATTGAAALTEGRRFLGLELSAEYFKIAGDRLRAFDGMTTVKAQAAGQGALFG